MPAIAVGMFLTNIAIADEMNTQKDYTYKANGAGQMNQNESEYYPGSSAGPILKNDRSVDVSISAEFLYWMPSMSDLPAISQINFTPRINLVTGDVLEADAFTSKTREFDWKYEPAFRVGMGLTFEPNGWDLSAFWTYLYTDVSRSKSNDNTLLDFSQTPTFPVEQAGSKAYSTPFQRFEGDFGNRARAKFKLLYNQIDLVVGRNFWVSKSLQMRPFFGARGVWSHMRLTTKVDVTNALQNPTTTFVRFLSNHHKLEEWGVGPVIGLNSKWFLHKMFYFYADGSVALLGNGVALKHKSAELDSFTNTVDDTSTFSSTTIPTYRHHHSITLIPMFDIALGLGWESYLCQERYHLAFSAGWDAHILVDYNYFDRSFEETTGQSTYTADGHLSFQGLTVKGRFQF